jgi:hypothetical protein
MSPKCSILEYVKNRLFNDLRLFSCIFAYYVYLNAGGIRRKSMIRGACRHSVGVFHKFRRNLKNNRKLPS